MAVDESDSERRRRERVGDRWAAGEEGEGGGRGKREEEWGRRRVGREAREEGEKGGGATGRGGGKEGVRRNEEMS